MTTLDEIGQKYGTDKASTFHDYLRIYERIIPANTPARLLEVGVYGGASLRMWREWLGEDALIVGVDINPTPSTLPAHVFRVDATSPAVVEMVTDPDVTDRYDFIIDDGSHLSPDVIATFLLLWPLVQAGGFYIIEDLHVAYHPAWKGSDTRTSQGRDQMSSMHFLKNLADEPHRGHVGEGPKFLPAVPGVQSIAFHPGLAIIEKRADA